jgi:hypothetical protein
MQADEKAGGYTARAVPFLTFCQIGIYPALRFVPGLCSKMRFTAALILRPFTSRNIRSIGVSRRRL